MNTNQSKLTGAAIAAFIFAGCALFTVRSVKTGTRYTFKVVQSADQQVFFVRVLNGPQNTDDYLYIGFVHAGDRVRLRIGKKGRANAPSTTAFAWFLQHLNSELVEVWHEGRCGKCGRVLTVPESIEAGIGPECAKQQQSNAAKVA